jgi:glucose-6-phosphate-specific signal transduction histidine kinase
MVIGKESITLARQALKNGFLWTVVALVILFAVYYYAADIAALNWLAPQGYLGITRQGFQRALFLIPVFVAAWKLGLKGGVACTIIIGVIMVPMAMASPWRMDAIVETAVIVVIGIISTRLVSSLEEARNLQQSIADDLKKPMSGWRWRSPSTSRRRQRDEN